MQSDAKAIAAALELGRHIEELDKLLGGDPNWRKIGPGHYVSRAVKAQLERTEP